MKLRRITSRLAIAGATTALAAGALVGATGTAADAAATSSNYDCSALGNPVGSFVLNLDVPLLPPTAPAGFPVTPGLLSYTSSINVPAGAAELLGQFGVDGGTIDDFAMSIGDTVVPAPGTYTANAPAQDGSVLMDGSGANGAFNLPAAGTYDVMMPDAFTFTPTVAGAPLPATVSCTSANPGSLGQVTLTKQAGTIKAKAVKKHKVIVSVANEYTKATGKVVAKVGKKKFTKTLNSAGKTVFKFPKSYKGKKAVIAYKGDSYTAGSKTSVKIK